MERRGIVLLLALAVTPPALAAQVSTPVAPDTAQTDSVTRDSAAEEPLIGARPDEAGRVAGRRAGSHGGGVIWRGGTAFVVGLPLGVVAPLGLFAREPAALAGTVGATALLVKMASGRGKVPPHLARAAQENGPEYARAFRESYGDRIRARRKRSVLIGGTIGTVTGAALLVLASLAFAGMT